MKCTICEVRLVDAILTLNGERVCFECLAYKLNKEWQLCKGDNHLGACEETK